MRPLEDHDPTHVGDYMLLGRLGRGGMARVYLARSRGGRLLAVKIVQDPLAADPEFRERFRREVEIARMVGGFWTAAVVDADPEATPPWLAAEYVAGPSLEQAVTEHGPLPEHSVRRLAAGLSEALQAIHQAELIHRDLKPSNVLLAADGPRVIDFGIARASGRSTLTASGMFVGTPGFLSPEQIDGETVGPASDVFSLGAVLAYAATGTGPFGAGDSSTLIRRAAASEPDLRAMPSGLREVAAACLHRDPAQRPTPAWLLARLGDTASTQASSAWLPEPVATLIERHKTRTTEFAAARRARRKSPPSTMDPPRPTRRATPSPQQPPAAAIASNEQRIGRVGNALGGILCLMIALAGWRLAVHPAVLGAPGRFLGILGVLACLSAGIALLIRATRTRE